MVKKKKSFVFVFGMWNKNHYSEQNQMEVSDFDLQFDQNSKLKKSHTPELWYRTVPLLRKTNLAVLS